jgi:hypothetical protein
MGFFSSLLNPFKSILGEVTGQNDALNQNQKAIDEQRLGREESTQTLRGMYMTGRQDQLPFITPSLSALPMYQSAVLGGAVDYADPRYQALTAFDPGYVQGQTKYRAPDGSIVDKAPTLSANYQLDNDPGFQWRNRQLDRSLRSLGRSNSTYGMQAKADFSGNEYDRSLSRLATLAGFGQGSAGNVAGQGNQAAGQIAGVNMNTARSLGDLYGQRGGLFTDYSPLNMAINAGKTAAAAGAPMPF